VGGFGTLQRVRAPRGSSTVSQHDSPAVLPAAAGGAIGRACGVETPLTAGQQCDCRNSTCPRPFTGLQKATGTSLQAEKMVPLRWRQVANTALLAALLAAAAAPACVRADGSRPGYASEATVAAHVKEAVHTMEGERRVAGGACVLWRGGSEGAGGNAGW